MTLITFESAMTKTGSAVRFRAFTLIELLAVIAIIALLASLPLPALARAKAAARFAVCKNKVKQISIALAMHTHDQGTYPLLTCL